MNEYGNSGNSGNNGRVEFHTAVKVILIISISLAGLNFLSSLAIIPMQGIDLRWILSGFFSLIIAGSELWLLIKRVRAAYFALAGGYVLTTAYNAAIMPAIMRETIVEINEMYAEMGIPMTFGESFVNMIVIPSIIGSVFFAAGFLGLIFFLIRKVWQHMPMF
jgi:hypothetical protein